jgi:16S rRNA pseudouridine516 synthase
MIKGIAFDLDGTLIDDTELLKEAECAAFAERGLIITPSELVKFNGMSIKDITKAFFGKTDKDTIKALRQRRKELVQERIERLKVFPETNITLRKLRKLGLKTGIATGLGGELLQIFLKKTHLSELMDTIVSADEVAAGKPAPDVFIKAFKLMGVSKENGLVVGDGESDITAARTAGIENVLIVRSGVPICSADHVICRLDELTKLVTSKNAAQ